MSLLTQEKRTWFMTNAGAIVATGSWWPFAESGAPSSLELSNQAPFKALLFENLSGEPFDLILEPLGSLGSGKMIRRVPDGVSLEISSEEGLTFHSVAMINQGALETAIGELKLTVKNY